MWIQIKTVLVCLILVAGFAFTAKMTFAFQKPVDTVEETTTTDPADTVGEVIASEAVDVASITAAVKEELQTNINVVWTCIAAFLVFFMQAGFAMQTP